MKVRMWRVVFECKEGWGYTTRECVVVAKNVKDAVVKAIAKEKTPGTNLHNVIKVKLVGEED